MPDPSTDTILNNARALDGALDLLCHGGALSPAMKDALRGRTRRAEALFEMALKRAPQRGTLLKRLGRIDLALGRNERAIERLTEAVTLLDDADAQFLLGIAEDRAGRTDRAITALKLALARDPELSSAMLELSRIEMSQGSYVLAADYARQAIALAPDDWAAHLNLGNSLVMAGQVEEGIDAFRDAISRSPNLPGPHHNLGMLLRQRGSERSAAIHLGHARFLEGDYAAARGEYIEALERGTENEVLLLRLAECHRALDDYLEAVATLQRAFARAEATPMAARRLYALLHHLGRTDDAIATATLAVERFPSEFFFRLKAALTLPIVYRSEGELRRARARFEEELKRLGDEVRSWSDAKRSDALSGLLDHVNFYLQYQCIPDHQLQRQYGELVELIVRSRYPDAATRPPVPPRDDRGRIRVGVLSDSMRAWGRVEIYRGWMDGLDRESIELIGYQLGVADHVTYEVAGDCDRFRIIPQDLDEIRRVVRADELHVLLIPDLGIAPFLTVIAAMRLAPRVGCMMAHSVTSGLKTVDWFFSCERMESESAAERYTEQLVKLPGIGLCVEVPPVDEATYTRRDFGLEEDAVVYLCWQATAKLLPRFDELWPAVLSQVPHSKLVLIGGCYSAEIDEILRARLDRAFTLRGLDSREQVIFLPRQSPRARYLSLYRVADVFLDSIGWSGALTTIDSIAFGLPVVTHAGVAHQARMSQGLLEQAGVGELVAANKREYVEFAVRLGRDPIYRRSVSDRLRDGHGRIFGDTAPARALSAFLCRSDDGLDS